jgi:hypothetical protein
VKEKIEIAAIRAMGLFEEGLNSTKSIIPEVGVARLVHLVVCVNVNNSRIIPSSVQWSTTLFISMVVCCTFQGKSHCKAPDFFILRESSKTG